MTWLHLLKTVTELRTLFILSIRSLFAETAAKEMKIMLSYSLFSKDSHQTNYLLLFTIVSISIAPR